MIGGEYNLLSPIFGLLSAVHELAYRNGLEDHALATRLGRAEVRPAGRRMELERTRAPAPAAGSLLPSRISASAYNALVACPYQYYAGYVLGLRELDEVEEELQKRDYGSLLHDVLTKFHRAHAVASDLATGAAQEELERLSHEAFAPIVARNYFAQAWLARWKGLIPSYLEWQCKREASGWRWGGGEVDRSTEIRTPKGVTITLHGRLDRIDVRQEPSNVGHQSSPVFAVIDYKARPAKALEDSLRVPGEDVQLAVYALLWGDAVTEAMFVSVDRREVDEVAPEQPILALAQGARERLAAIFDSLDAGAKLPAQGTEAACEYCEARGLCRKDYWND
jgi:ATP-dependent helicase/nuclease subunit B